jgi:glycosyltransferase involved in cell wall biosynthesis
MTDKKLLLLMGFTEDDTKMASVRWKRFKKQLCRDGFSVDWIPIRLPYCDESSSAASKTCREFTVLRHARRLAKQLARDRCRDTRTAVLASIPILDPLYVGAMLKRFCRSNVQLILEIRDVYARPELFKYSGLRKRLEVFKETMLIRPVDKLIYLTDEIRSRYCAYYPRLSSIRNGIVITNGYDPEEYGPPPSTESNGKMLEIGYFGSFYATRNPELLFQTLGGLRSRNAQDITGMRVHIWGETGHYPLEEKIRQYHLQGTILYHGVVSHESIMREYTGTGVNLIITHTTGSSYALPGKLFEYVGARRPVWAITDDRILRDFITRHRLGYLSSHDTGSIEATLRTILRDHAGVGKLPEITPPQDFEISSLTRELETFVFDGC